MQVVLWSLADHVSGLSVHDQGTFDGKREKLSSRTTLKASHLHNYTPRAIAPANSPGTEGEAAELVCMPVVLRLLN